jgi:hypothetical protein
VNLILACFWLVVAVGAFVLSWVEPDLQILRLAGTGVNVGWLALAFSVYNCLRWQSSRLVARRKQQWAEASGRNYRPRREDAEPNPAFDFSDQPPPDERMRPGR